MLLRPDNATSLISAPYYAKDTKKGDSTAFRHVDFNLQQMTSSSQRGLDQIQGSVSLDDEQADDCTEIVPKMHPHLAEWCKRIMQRGVKSNSYVNKITSKYLTKEDLKEWGTN